jgi:hypothetical protein
VDNYLCVLDTKEGPGSSVGIATTGWRVRGWNPGVERFFAHVKTGPGAKPSLLYNGYRVFTGGKAAGAWC